MALLIGPGVALLGVLLAFVVLRTRARRRSSLYANRRSELQKLAAARRAHALDPKAPAPKPSRPAAAALAPAPRSPAAPPSPAPGPTPEEAPSSEAQAPLSPAPRAGDAWDSSPTRLSEGSPPVIAAAAAQWPSEPASSAPVVPPADEAVGPPPEPMAEPVAEAVAPAAPPAPLVQSDWSVTLPPVAAIPPPVEAPPPEPALEPAAPEPAAEVELPSLPDARVVAEAPAGDWEPAVPLPVEASAPPLSTEAPAVPAAAAAASPDWEVAEDSTHDAKANVRSVAPEPPAAAEPAGWSIIGEGGAEIVPGEQSGFRAGKKGKDKTWESGLYGEELKESLLQTLLGYAGLVAALVVVLLGVILMISATR